jgi:hypothetical protein
MKKKENKMIQIKSLAFLCFVCLFLFSACTSNDKAAWSEASKKNTVESYQAYVQLFPNGKHLTEAQNKIVLLTPKAPDCNDIKVKDEVLKIAKERMLAKITKEIEMKRKYQRKHFLERILGHAGEDASKMDPRKISQELSYNMENVRISHFVKEIGKYECAADLIVKKKERTSKMPINYTSELSDGGKNFYVSVSGL